MEVVTDVPLSLFIGHFHKGRMFFYFFINFFIVLKMPFIQN